MDDLRGQGVIRSGAVAAALRAVPRHRFAPRGGATDPYVDEPILLKRDAAGAPVSTISQPQMVAVMLEELEVRPGDRILEVGTASGYNAALLAELTGPDGLVVTVEIEADLAERARSALSELGVANVEVVTGDGYEGARTLAPFDRVIVTAGAGDLAPAWIDQLREGGRLVVPLGSSHSSMMCRTYQLRSGALELLREIPCSFVPLRRAGVSGPATHPDHR